MSRLHTSFINESLSSVFPSCDRYFRLITPCSSAGRFCVRQNIQVYRNGNGKTIIPKTNITMNISHTRLLMQMCLTFNRRCDWIVIEIDIGLVGRNYHPGYYLFGGITRQPSQMYDACAIMCWHWTCLYKYLQWCNAPEWFMFHSLIISMMTSITKAGFQIIGINIGIKAVEFHLNLHIPIHFFQYHSQSLPLCFDLSVSHCLYQITIIIVTCVFARPVVLHYKINNWVSLFYSSQPYISMQWHNNVRYGSPASRIISTVTNI